MFKSETKPYAVCCPVCGGRGLVKGGFYDLILPPSMYLNAAPETCRACGGLGYIIPDEKPDLATRLAEAEEVIDAYANKNSWQDEKNGLLECWRSSNKYAVGSLLAQSYRDKYPKGQ